MKTKIQTLLDQLNHGLVERNDILKTALLAVLAGENVVLIGPPGTGKSMIASRIAKSLHNSDGYFEYLLTKFSTPEELFGPLSISELKKDRFKRNTAGYLPAVNMAFLDEIFKASSSILNALLTILNERVYHNGAEAQRVPLQALIAASNEVPVGQEELGALYDRFTMRIFVDYVSRDSLPLLFEKAGPMPELVSLTDGDLQQIRQAAEAVVIPSEIVAAVQRIWVQHDAAFKDVRGESLSDRRLKKVINLLCVSAASNGRQQVDLSDVMLLKDCLWNHPDHAVKVRELVIDALRTFSRIVPMAADASSPAPAARKAGGTVKGLVGRGTAEDPLLIASVHDLTGLERTTVGKHGYHFLQTADIDCTGISSWTSIPFKGHYDGGGHAIKYKMEGNDVVALFSEILPQSSIANLELRSMRLAVAAEGSSIMRCVSDVGFIEGEARGCAIADCLAVLDLQHIAPDGFFILYGKRYTEVGGIATSLSEGSIVERCFVAGAIQQTGPYEVRFSGMAPACIDSSIRLCAVGSMDLSGAAILWGPRIGAPHGAATLENNATIESSGKRVGNGADGKSVAPALFKQAYFEFNLDWDFDTVWQWDDEHDRPVLRPYALRALNGTAGGTNMADLLTRQIRANIWL